jgi:RNA polymerase sporulation-specific sigma factor
MVTIEEAQANKELMDIFIEENMGLVGKAIKNLHIPPTDDYIQEGAIGLIKAARRFDINRGFAFSTYAISVIEGAMRKYMRDYGNTTITGAKVPRDIQYLYYKILRFDHLTDEDICKELNITMKELKEARQAMGYYASLDEDIHKNDSGDTPILLHDVLASDYDTEEDAVEKLLKCEIIDCLFQNISDEHAEILTVYLQGKTQMQIKDIVGLSQAQVSRILIKITNLGKQIVEGGIKLKITYEQLLAECREHGTGNVAQVIIAKKYGMTPGSVSNCIARHKICAKLKEEKELLVKSQEKAVPTPQPVPEPQVIVENKEPDMVKKPEVSRISTLKPKAWGGKENTYSFHDGKLIITNNEGTLEVKDLIAMISELQELADRKEAV